MPGPYPGRVVEVAYPGKVARRDFKRESVDQMLTRFQLDKISVAKYALSIDEVRARGRLAALQARLYLSTFGQIEVLGFAAVLSLVAILGKMICAFGVVEKGLDRRSNVLEACKQIFNK